MYRKGAAAERKLISLLEERGFVAVRVAGSGRNAPDVLAFKEGKAIAFEVKAVNKDFLVLDSVQKERLLLWAKKAGIPVFLAWKKGRRWHFYEIEAIKGTIRDDGLSLEEILQKA